MNTLIAWPRNDEDAHLKMIMLIMINIMVIILKTSTGQKSFAYRGAKVWSDLNSGVKATSSLCSFHCNYKAKKL